MGGTGGRGGTAEGREARQLQRELERRTQDAEALRRELTGIGPSGNGRAERLGQVVSALRGLNPERLTGDPRGMEILEAEVLDTLRQLEFELRRALAGGSGADVLTGSERPRTRGVPRDGRGVLPGSQPPTGIGQGTPGVHTGTATRQRSETAVR